jgi:hypothetical protein
MWQSRPQWKKVTLCSILWPVGRTVHSWTVQESKAFATPLDKSLTVVERYCTVFSMQQRCIGKRGRICTLRQLLPSANIVPLLFILSTAGARRTFAMQSPRTAAACVIKNEEVGGDSSPACLRRHVRSRMRTGQTPPDCSLHQVCSTAKVPDDCS